MNLNANQSVQDTSAKVQLEKEKSEKSDVENQLRSKVGIKNETILKA